jgi:hypothetical protein
LGHLARALQQTGRYLITPAQPNSDSGDDFRLMDDLDHRALDDRRKTFH